MVQNALVEESLVSKRHRGIIVGFETPPWKNCWFQNALENSNSNRNKHRKRNSSSNDNANTNKTAVAISCQEGPDTYHCPALTSP